MQSDARMAVMRPDLVRILEAMKYDPAGHEMATKLRYQQEMVTLFKKYKVNPLHSLLMPLAQLPIFISFFIGLRDMGNHFPEFTTGGALWFVNLSVPDPYYILPVLNSLSFLVMVEIGAEGMETANKDTFKWVMRGLAVAMTPLTMYMPQVRLTPSLSLSPSCYLVGRWTMMTWNHSHLIIIQICSLFMLLKTIRYFFQGLFVYWSANNTISIAQAALMKLDYVRNILGIPKPPPSDITPPLKIKNPFLSMYEVRTVLVL